MDIQHIFIAGAGNMGAGIAEVMARAGLTVTMSDVSSEVAEAGRGRVRKSLDRAVSRGKATPEEAEAALAQITPAAGFAAAAEADFILEAVSEDLAVKEEVFRTLDGLARPEVVLVSNTSTIPIARLAAATNRPGRVAGMHFFNPAPIMALVEVIRGPETAEETVAIVRGLAERAGKTPVLCQDSPGFIVNRCLFPLINEAAWLLYQGTASRDDIDTALKLGCNHPLGPLALADLIGVDVSLATLEILQREFQDDKFAPCPLFREMVERGELGRKVGQGFYKYE
jgi:3-hydroxybutyryl-CoA dehydrogenase